MSTNYPIVRLTNAAGAVTYATTFNWTPGVADTAYRTVQFTVPSGFTPVSLEVIASGIASDSFNFGATTSVNASSFATINDAIAYAAANEPAGTAEVVVDGGNYSSQAVDVNSLVAPYVESGDATFGSLTGSYDGAPSSCTATQ